ncbi:MAG: VRR-NUC domain-containing protein [Methylobacter sp.]
MANAETVLQQNIRLALGKLPGVRLFRNNVGQAETSDGSVIQYGLCRGSSDLVGWKTVEITPDMVGQRVAIFTAIEIKTAKGRMSELQQNFINRVQLDGGISGVARSIEDAEALCR